MPQTLKQGESRGLLYRVRWAVRSNFTPRSRKTMQFTCPTALLIASSVAYGILALCFLIQDLLLFSFTLSDKSDTCKGVCWCLHVHINKVIVFLWISAFYLYFMLYSHHTKTQKHLICALSPPFPFPPMFFFSLPLVLGNSIMEKSSWKPFLYVFM